MNNVVKLTQANGKGLMVPASSLKIIRTLEPSEKKEFEKGKSAIWLELGGVAQSAIVREQYGHILRLAGGPSSERVQLAGPSNTKISMPRDIIAHAIEIETPGEDGELEDITVVHTNLTSNVGPVVFHAKESVSDLYDSFNIDGVDIEEDEDEDEDDSEEEGTK